MKKIVARRDSALKLLRKAGINKEDYDKHLTKVPSGFQVIIPDGVETAAKKTTAPKKSAKKKVTAPKKKDGKPSVASVIRELVAEGKTNAEIWVIIKKQFKLDDGKKYYPAWYRKQAERIAKKKKK